MPIDMKKYKAEFKRQRAKGKKWGQADTIAMKHAALPYKTKPKLKIKSKVKEDISPREKLRRKILKTQKGYVPKPKPKVKPTPKKKSLLEKTRERVKKLFSKKKKKKLKTKRTTQIEQQLKKAGVSKKQISKLQGKKK